MWTVAGRSNISEFFIQLHSCDLGKTVPGKLKNEPSKVPYLMVSAYYFGTEKLSREIIDAE
jgi:hypothetical protein